MLDGGLDVYYLPMVGTTAVLEWTQCPRYCQLAGQHIICIGAKYERSLV